MSDLYTTVQLLSGDRYTFTLFEGYRVLSLQNEMNDILHCNRDRITISRRNEDGEYNVCDPMEYVESGENYYAAISVPNEPLTFYLTQDDSEPARLIIRDEHGVVYYRNHQWEQLPLSVMNDESVSLHVQLSAAGWDTIRRETEEFRGPLYPSEDEYAVDDEDTESRYNIADCFYSNYIANTCSWGAVHIDIHIEDEDEEDEEDW